GSSSVSTTNRARGNGKRLGMVVLLLLAWRTSHDARSNELDAHSMSGVGGNSNWVTVVSKGTIGHSVVKGPGLARRPEKLTALGRHPRRLLLPLLDAPQHRAGILSRGRRHRGPVEHGRQLVDALIGVELVDARLGATIPLEL